MQQEVVEAEGHLIDSQDVPPQRVSFGQHFRQTYGSRNPRLDQRIIPSFSLTP
jgi:hypothetical protein